MALSYLILVGCLSATVSAKHPNVHARMSEPVQCEQDGEVYNVGDTMPTRIHCLECHCGPQGEPVCMTPMCSRPFCGTGLVLLPGPPGSCCEEKCSDYCVINEQRYELNDVIPSDNACEECTCTSGLGRICFYKECIRPICTSAQRLETPPGSCCPICVDAASRDANACTVEGVTYNDGDSVPSDDDCLVCRCEGGDGVKCNRKHCGMPHCPNGARPIMSPHVCCPFCPGSQSPSRPGGPPGGRPSGRPHGRPARSQTQEDSTCTVEGVTYNDGDRVPSDDVCLNCHCDGEDGVQCNRKHCGWPHCTNGARPMTSPHVCCPFCSRTEYPQRPGGPPGGHPSGQLPGRPGPRPHQDD